MVRVRFRVQTPWNHTPDTMDATRQYGYCRHNGKIHQALCMSPGNMDTIGTVDTRKTIQNTLWTLPDTAYTSKPYTDRNIFHKQPLTLRDQATIQLTH